MGAESFYEAIGVPLPAGHADEASVRCFANPEAHEHGDRNPSARVNRQHGGWCCHGCGAAGGAYHAALARGYSPAEAMRLVDDHDLRKEPRVAWAGGSGAGPSPRAADPAPTVLMVATEENIVFWMKVLEESPRALERLAELRAWEPDVLARFGVGLEGMREGDRITLPLRDAAGRLVGLGRYAPNPGTRKGQRKMLALSGSVRVIFPRPEDALVPGERAYVCEGESAALTGLSIGVAAVGIPGAGYAGRWTTQDTKRVSEAGEIVLLPDADPKGREAMRVLAGRLAAAGLTVRVLDLHPEREDGADVGDWVLARRGEGHEARAIRAELDRLADVAPSVERHGGDVEAEQGSLATESQEVAPRGAAAPPLRFLTADEYLARSPRVVPWVWRGYLARGAVTMLSGPPKRGKSTLVWSLVDALRRGAESFLGREVSGGAVVYLSEEGEDTLADKVRAGPGLTVVDRAATFPRRPWAEVVAAAGDEAARQRAVLVVVDTLPWFAGLGPEGEKDAGRMQEALEPLLALAARGFAVLIIHHDRKGGGEDGEAARGSSAAAATVDAVIDLARRPTDEAPSGRRTLLALSRWGSETPDALVYERQRDGALVALAEGDRGEAGQRALHRRVLDTIPLDGTTVTVKDVAAALGVSDERVRRPLKEMVASEELELLPRKRRNEPDRYRRPVPTPPSQPPLGTAAAGAGGSSVVVWGPTTTTPRGAVARTNLRRVNTPLPTGLPLRPSPPPRTVRWTSCCGVAAGPPSGSCSPPSRTSARPWSGLPRSVRRDPAVGSGAAYSRRGGRVPPGS
jgi:hypothetical protein